MRYSTSGPRVTGRRMPFDQLKRREFITRGGRARATCPRVARVRLPDRAELPDGLVRERATAMQTIVFGRGRTACGDATWFYTAGMCDVFKRIPPANVRIVYTQAAAPAGLGFAGRPGGLVPTIKISLQNMPFRFFFLGNLLVSW